MPLAFANNTHALLSWQYCVYRHSGHARLSTELWSSHEADAKKLKQLWTLGRERTLFSPLPYIIYEQNLKGSKLKILRNSTKQTFCEQTMQTDITPVLTAKITTVNYNCDMLTQHQNFIAVTFKHCEKKLAFNCYY